MPSDSPLPANAYDAFGTSFAQSRKNMEWQEIAALCERLSEKNPHPRILDVGSGSGRLLNVLEGKFGPNFEYLGVDASKILVSVAKKDFPNRNFRAGDMRNLRTVPEIREGEKFDAVFAVASFHHLLTEEDRRKALDEFASVLAPNGMLLMTNWNLLSASNLAKYGKRRDSSGVFHIPFSGKPRTYFALEPTVLSRELAQSGWEVLESIENERNLTTIARFLG